MTKRSALKDESLKDIPLVEGRDPLDTIPDQEAPPDEHSQIQEVRVVDQLISRQRTWYTQNGLVINELEVLKLKFCYSLFYTIRREFLKPVVRAIQEKAPDLSEIGQAHRRNFLAYIRILDVPQYRDYLPPTALAELETIGLVENWEHINSLTRIRDQIRDILGLPQTKTQNE